MYTSTSGSPTRDRLSLFSKAIVCLGIVVSGSVGWSQELQWLSPEEQLAKVEKAFGDPPNTKRLVKDGRVWIDRDHARVIVDGYIALRAGQLEMFACPGGTKEHESVVGVYSKAEYVHAALLAVGGEAGKPVSFEPKYTPASGSEVRIWVLWIDEKGEKHKSDARAWVRQAGTDKQLESNWVFAGSRIWTDPETKEKAYLAESGDLVCVSNFPAATLDLPVRSSQANTGLLYTAYTNRIPPETTPVRLVFEVVNPKNAAKPASPSENANSSAKSDNDVISALPASTPVPAGSGTPKKSESPDKPAPTVKSDTGGK